MPPNFQNGKIYSIRSYQTEKIYIGSTTQSLAVRFGGHKRSMDCSSREILQFADAYIELIELFPCASKMALNLREGEIIRTRVCVNKLIPGRTQTEWREDNKETISGKQKQYYEDNKESILVQKKQYYEDNKEDRKQYWHNHTEERKQYYEDNKERISEKGKQYAQTHKKMRICSCGVEYNDGSSSHRNQHYGSKHHIEFVNDFYERLHQLLVDNLIIPD
jgi:hypothetical protein